MMIEWMDVWGLWYSRFGQREQTLLTIITTTAVATPTATAAKTTQKYRKSSHPKSIMF